MARPKTTKKRSAKQTKSRKYRFFIPYPALMFVLICAGVLLAMWSFRAAADDIVINGVVDARPVSSSATILTPSDGASFSTNPITVSGTCPADGSGGYVKIYDNGIFRGTSVCQPGETFGLSVNLFLGANRLVAHIYNITDAEGPISAPVTVSYSPPKLPTSPSLTTPAANNSPPFIINTEFRYIGYYVGQSAQWNLDVTGGQAPYAINVDWGDGKSSLISQKSPGSLTIQHRYTKPGTAANHTYVIKISGSDSSGNQDFMQLFVIVNPKNLGPVAATISGPAACSATNIFSSVWCGLQNKSFLKYVWPAYGILLIMVVSYWLGEREELLVLTKRGRIRRRQT